jgi:hypothetical protein
MYTLKFYSDANKKTVANKSGKRKDTEDDDIVVPSSKKTKNNSSISEYNHNYINDYRDNFDEPSRVIIPSHNIFKTPPPITTPAPNFTLPAYPPPESQLTMLAEKYFTPLTELIASNKSKDDNEKQLLYTLRNEDKTAKKEEMELQERIKKEELALRISEIEREERIKKEEMQLRERIKREELAVRSQDRDKEREERMKETAMANNYYLFRMCLIFGGFVAVCMTLSYILSALKEVFLEYFKK